MTIPLHASLRFPCSPATCLVAASSLCYRGNKEVLEVTPNYSLVGSRAGIATSSSPRPLLWGLDSFRGATALAVRTAPAACTPRFHQAFPEGPGSKPQFFDLLSSSVHHHALGLGVAAPSLKSQPQTSHLRPTSCLSVSGTDFLVFSDNS